MEVKNFSNIQPLNGAMTRQILSDRIVLFKKMEIVMRGMNDSMEFIRSLGVKPTDAMMKDILSCGSITRNALLGALDESDTAFDIKEDIIDMFDKVHKFLYDIGCESPVPLYFFYYDEARGVGVSKELMDEYVKSLVSYRVKHLNVK